jgi:hypothetical protein
MVAAKINNPSAVVIIYNYKDRLGTIDASDRIPGLAGDSDQVSPEEEVEPIIVGSSSLISVSTNKSKSNPVGTFEVVLAPTNNWLSLVTPGSWCVILMSRDTISTDDIDVAYNPSASNEGTRAKEESLRMVGKIDSVRQAVSTDPTTGMLSTRFVMSGYDWGHVFNSFLYVDPAARTRTDDALGASERLFYEQLVTTYNKPETKLSQYTSTAAVQALLKFWGSDDPASGELVRASDNTLLGRTKNDFSLPKELAKYLNFYDPDGQLLTKVADVIKIRSGKLVGSDSYSGKNYEQDYVHGDGVGMIQPSSIFGTNSLWQLLTQNSNDTINELLCDIRFEDGNPLFTLYKRIRPFQINTIDSIVKDDSDVGDSVAAQEPVKQFLENNLSYFKYVKNTIIPLEDIVSINIGTNWRDRYNFVEVLLGRQLVKNPTNLEYFSASLKKELQFFDKKSIRRDGLTPMTMTIKYIPIDQNGNIANVDLSAAYKYIAKEWYFNTHKMLNGSLTMMGTDKYIQVGDNIMIPIKAISSNFNLNVTTQEQQDDAYLMAHVENIGHTVSVNAVGARTYATTIQFVRGVIASSSGEPFSQDATAMLDQNSAVIPVNQKVNSDRVLNTPTKADPSTRRW